MNTYTFMAQKLAVIVFSSNSDVGLVENVAENIRRKKEFAKFRMLQIEEGKHVYHIYTFVLNADVSNGGDIGM